MKHPLAIVAIVLVVSGALIGGYTWFSHGTKRTATFTTPIPDELNNRSLTLGGRVALEEELRAFAEQMVAQGQLSDYSVYYQEFVSGPVIAINESRGFFPASLLKLPVALWYFKQAQERPELLLEEIHFAGPRGSTDGHFLPQHPIAVGTTYTIEELIKLMLTESDNDATQVLVEYAGGREVINEVYEELDIRNVDNYETYVMDTQTYGAFFRVLFNARYIDREYSERILSMLTDTSFKTGMVGGLPEDVVVAHKFGERTLDENGPVEQLHECGIVYAPANPYLLCIMTQGSDYDVMAAFIREASRRVFEAAAKPS